MRSSLGLGSEATNCDNFNYSNDTKGFTELSIKSN